MLYYLIFFFGVLIGGVLGWLWQEIGEMERLTRVLEYKHRWKYDDDC